jgi:hypothetical protein
MKYLRKSALLMASMLLAGLVAEWFARTQGFTAVGSYLQRYQIEGNGFPVIGYVGSHDQMPYALKRNFSHTVVDLTWFPEPWTVTLNNEGYRNAVNAQGRRFDRLIVGDSVAFGYGVSDDFTIANTIERIAGETVYSAAIPGAGPAMYMYMIDEFLSRADADLITVLFYDGNDYANLQFSEWLPTRTNFNHETVEISRADVSCSPAHPPVFLSYPLLRASAVARLATKVFSSANDCGALRAADFEMVYRPALALLGARIERPARVADNEARALGAVEALATSPCAAPMRGELDQVRKRIEAGRVEEAYAVVSQVTAALIELECLPISSAKRNALSFFHYYAGFYYHELYGLDRGEDGAVKDLKATLRRVGSRSAEMEPLARQATRLLEDVGLTADGLVQLTELLGRISERLSEQRVSETTATTPEKTRLFLDYLSTLTQEEGVRIEVVILPAEYKMANYPDYASEEYSLCLDAADLGVECRSMIPFFQEYYADSEHSSLSLEGSHFTEEGNEVVARWLLGLLR